MTFLGRHPKTLVLASILIILFLTSLLFDVYLLPNKSDESACAHDAVISCTVIDTGTGLPVSDTQAELNLSTPNFKIPIIGLTTKDGSLSKAISNWNDSSLQINEVILAGKWIIQNVTGDRVYRLDERLWKCIDAKSFLLGCSKYSFDGVKLQQKTLKDHLEFCAVLYVSTARVLAVLNPLRERISAYIAGSRGFWERESLVEFAMTDSNFVEVENTDFVLIPENHPLKIGILFRILDFTWNFKTEINVTNREFADLTEPILREFSNRQIQEATSMLDIMWSQGFDLKEQYEQLEKVKEDYNRAIDAFNSANYTEGLDYARNGWIKYLSIYTQIRGIHSQTLPWSIAMLLILLFFSFISARLIAGHRADLWKKLIPLILLPFFLLFFFTQPHLRLFLLSPFLAIERLDMIFFANFLATLPWLFFLFTLAITPRFRDMLWETLEISLRNMYRRRLRSLMTISTIMIVSASAMCVLTISPYAPSISIPLSMAQPTVQQGLLIEQYEMLTPAPGTKTSPGQAPQAMQMQVALPISEAMWLTKHPRIDSYNMYGLKYVRIADSAGQNIANFSRFSLVIINPSFVEKYCLLSSHDPWLTDEDEGEVLVGSKIASAYRLSPGVELLIDGKVFKVKDTFDEHQAVKNCKEIHGENFFIKVYDPATETISGESFIIGSMNDFSLESFSIYRVSMITSCPIDDLNSIVDDILQHGYSHETTMEYDITRSYKAYAIINGKVTCRFYSATETTIAGPWQMQTVLLILSATIVSLNVLASVNERKKEIQAIFASGATPLRIRMVFIAESLTFGLTGSLYGYVFMFLLVRVGGIALPSSIQQNLVDSSPFVISLATGVLASIVGSLPTSVRAVLSVVPSKRVLQKDKDIFTREAERVIIDVPLKLQESELATFDSFITHLAEELTPKRFYFDGIGILDIERMEKKEHVTYVLNMNYSAEKNAFYKTAISIRKNAEPKEIEVVIYPLDTMRRIVSKWKAEHNITLSRFAGQLRSDLLKYVGSKGNKQRSGSAK